MERIGKIACIIGVILVLITFIMYLLEPVLFPEEPVNTLEEGVMHCTFDECTMLIPADYDAVVFCDIGNEKVEAETFPSREVVSWDRNCQISLLSP